MSLPVGDEVESALEALWRLGPDQRTAVLERLHERAGLPGNTATWSLLLYVTMNQESELERLAGEPQQVHETLETAFTDLRIRAEARRAVLAQPLLAAGAVAEALGSTGTNTREAASTLRRKGDLVGVMDKRRYLYLAFQIDPLERRVRPVVSDVNHVLDAKGDAWGVASWWVSPHPRLDDRAPMDLVAGPDEADLRVLARTAVSD